MSPCPGVVGPPPRPTAHAPPAPRSPAAQDGKTSPLALARSEEMKDMLRSADPLVGWVYREDGVASTDCRLRGRPVTPVEEQAAPAAPGESIDLPEGTQTLIGRARSPSPSPRARSPSPLPARGRSPSPLPATRGRSPSPSARVLEEEEDESVYAEPAPLDATQLGLKLSQACFFGDQPEIVFLINSGADVHVRDGSGMTALHWVASRGGCAAAQQLISAGADVGSRTIEGWTPLHWAARSGRAEVAKLLLRSGADAGARNDAGRTPFQMCESESVRAVIREHAGFAAVVATHRAPVQLDERKELILDEMRRIRSRSRSPSPAPRRVGTSSLFPNPEAVTLAAAASMAKDVAAHSLAAAKSSAARRAAMAADTPRSGLSAGLSAPSRPSLGTPFRAPQHQAPFTVQAGARAAEEARRAQMTSDVAAAAAAAAAAAMRAHARATSPF